MRGGIPIVVQCGQLPTREYWVDTFVVNASEAFHRKILDLEDKAIRELLIGLGWTPPPFNSPPDA